MSSINQNTLERVSSTRASGAVVVIEDEAIVLAGYQMLFESWGYHVVAAQSEDEAIELLTRQHVAPSFILADFRLRNGKTGTEAIDRLRQTFGWLIPGVVVTGDTAVSVDGLKTAAAAGMPILHKPVNGRQLQDILTKSLGR